MNETETPVATPVLAPSLRDIEAAVCARFGLTWDMLHGPSRCRGIVRPRQIVMYLAREMTPLSYPRIGAHFQRDHTTVLSGERRIRELIQIKPKLAAYVREVRALVRPREKEQARAWAQQPMVIEPLTETQAILPLVRESAQRKGGGFSGRGTCDGESRSSRAKAETGGG